MADAFLDKKVASVYAQVRPTVPGSIVDEIVKFYQNGDTKSRVAHAVDVGCGSGQFSVLVAAVAGNLTAVDFSAAQIEEAKKKRARKNITYMVASYENLPVGDGSIDLITSAQAAHFFEREKFHSEVMRCLRSGGCLALTGYGPAQLQNVPQEVAAANSDLLDVKFRPFWFPERHLVDNCYRDMPLPFLDNKRFDTYLQKELTVESYSSYLKSSSAYYKFKKSAKGSDDIVDKFIAILASALGGNRTALLKVRWPIFLLMSRK